MLALSWLNAGGYAQAMELLVDDPGRVTDRSLQYAYGVALVRSGRAAQAETVFAEPYHTLVPGYATGTVNMLRLWRADDLVARLDLEPEVDLDLLAGLPGVIGAEVDERGLEREARLLTKAVDAALETHRRIRLFNQSDLAGEHPTECCAGIGFGRVFAIGPNLAQGDEMNRASKLGEDIARANETLLTERAFEAVRHRDDLVFERQGQDDQPFSFYRTISKV